MWRRSSKREWFCRWCPQTIAVSLSSSLYTVWCCRQRNVCHTSSILFCICHMCSVWQCLLRKTCINSFHVHVIGLWQWTSCTSSYKGADTRPASALMFLHNRVQLSSRNGPSPGISSTLLRVCWEIQQPFLDGSTLNGLGFMYQHPQAPRGH